MSNIVESKTEIQVDVPMTEDDRIKCSDLMLDALNSIQSAHADIKNFTDEKKEDISKYNEAIGNARSKLTDKQLSKESRIALTNEIVEALNAISRASDILESYKQQKKAEILKYEGTLSECRIKLDRGRDFKWLGVKLLKDYDKKIKKYIDLKTGEIIKTLPMSDDEMQMPLAE
jgi:small-conductance mechanosensitive channel